MATSCPMAYRLGAKRFRSCPSVQASTVFAVGGLYGNSYALSAVLRRTSRERQPSLVVMNGDFNFFNADPRWWSETNTLIRKGVFRGDGESFGASPVRLLATQGNVEVEISERSSGGCGCGYPSYVSPGVITRSDEIVSQLRAAAHHPAADRSIITWLRSLPPALAVEVVSPESSDSSCASKPAARIAILHGDPENLSGWGLSSEAVDAEGAGLAPEYYDSVSTPNLGAEGGIVHSGQISSGQSELSAFIDQQRKLRRQLGFDVEVHERSGRERLLSWFGQMEVRAILSTHSCLAFAQDLLPSEREASVHGLIGGAPLAVFNNGSAGMPNFAGERCGLMTRVSADEDVPADSIYGVQVGPLRIDAVPVLYDHEAWWHTFRKAWPVDSAAALSYADRIDRGPNYTRAMAMRLTGSGCRDGRRPMA